MLKDHTSFAALASSSFIHIEAGMPPSANVRDDLRADRALG
jgi:hypothetical protein